MEDRSLDVTSTRPTGCEVPRPGLRRRQDTISAALYWTIHAACALVLVTGVSAADLILCLALFWLRLFGITGGYHRYFSHRSYRTSRPFQLVLATLGCAATQKGPLWWAAGHRRHHAFSDREGDLHSPRDGFWWAHQGWIFDGRFDATEHERVRDLGAFPELVWLDRWHPVVPLALAIGCFAWGGLSGLVWGFCVSTTLLWHATYSINSLAHRFGTQRYETGDDSRNNLWLALLTLGEGWHNNHHHYMASCRQGFFWWEVDVTYYVLRGLSAVGLVWDLREPPARLLAPADTDPEARLAA
ncbi:MAG: acyl-CoA desaturase [Spirochaetaceae bacterium]|nr:acyl-CoA desaturase [Spirochaetaceae bacterium]